MPIPNVAALMAELHTRAAFRYRTDRDNARIAEITDTLARHAAAPEGYTLPPAAAALGDHALREGWISAIRWGTGPSTGRPYVVLDMRHPAYRPGRDRLMPWMVVAVWHTSSAAGGWYFSGGFCRIGEGAHGVHNPTAAANLITCNPA
ncbi:hypothetical protein ABTX81_30455 [Kitasatospora sp. NPDC097605]|uniref:hypothetical protein n=1 Tax=Kitasatospora sp. NPDC097605 TaxID=3157226 RepID=UPI0033339562